MRSLIGLFFCAALFLATADASAYDPPDGFRGLKWGTLISAVKQEMVLAQDDGDVKWYSRKEDKLKIGDATLTDIVYCFYKGKFYVVLINFKGLTNYARIKQTLFEKYGPGYQSNQFMEKYRWGISASTAILLDYASDEGSLIYQYKEIADQKEQDDKEKSKDAGKDV